MTITIEATFQSGILRPKEPLDLAEGAKVQVTIRPLNEIEAGESDPLDEVIGICTEGPDISLAERHDEILYGLRGREESGT